MKPFLKPDDDDKHVMLTFIVMVSVFVLGAILGVSI